VSATTTGAQQTGRGGGRTAPGDHATTVGAVMRTLESAYRDELWHWMPDVARPIDVIVGAVLVQHTTWTNAERALESLRAAGALDTKVLAWMPEDGLASLVRVSGTPTVKARRLRALAETIERAGGSDAFLALPLEALRPLLLETHGIGPETADAIALYAASHRTFIIDAYTRRLFGRLGLGPQTRDGYAAWQRYFEDALLGADAAAFQRYHGYIVLHCKARCRATPACGGCPLHAECPYHRETSSDA
jgi:endonuclease-3 related protein